MLLIVLGVLVELYRPIRTYLTVKNEDPVVYVEFGSLAVWKCGVLRTERPFSATVHAPSRARNKFFWLLGHVLAY